MIRKKVTVELQLLPLRCCDGNKPNVSDCRYAASCADKECCVGLQGLLRLLCCGGGKTDVMGYIDAACCAVMVTGITPAVLKLWYYVFF